MHDIIDDFSLGANSDFTRFVEGSSLRFEDMSRGPVSGPGNDAHLGHYSPYYRNITHFSIRRHVHGSFGREFVRSVTKAEFIGLKPSVANEIPFPSTVEGGPLEPGQGPSRGSRTASFDISAAPIKNKSIALSSSSTMIVSWAANAFASSFRQMPERSVSLSGPLKDTYS